jgi:hypothetical protein
MIGLPQIKTCIVRLRELAERIGREVYAQKNDALLAPLERRRYLYAMTNALAELDAARDALVKAAARLEQPGR